MGLHERSHTRIGDLLRCMVLLVFCTLALSACQEQAKKSSEAQEKITVAYPRTVLSVLYHVAFSKGFFQMEGLDLTPRIHEFGKIAFDSMLEGKADLAIVAESPIMYAVTGGREVTLIGTTMTSRKDVAIIARKDRGIAIPTDLNGKTVGVVSGTAANFFLDLFVSTRGMARQQLNIVDVSPSDMQDALFRGQVDAVSIWNPILMQLKRGMGDQAVVFYDEVIYRDFACLAAQPEFVRYHPEAVKKSLRALIRAETFIKENPKEAQRLAADFLQIGLGVLEEIWDSYDFKVTLDQSLILSLEDQTRWAQGKGLTSKTGMPNYLDFIYFDGLLSVQPEAVRIIR